MVLDALPHDVRLAGTDARPLLVRRCGKQVKLTPQGGKQRQQDAVQQTKMFPLRIPAPLLLDAAVLYSFFPVGDVEVVFGLFCLL